MLQHIIDAWSSAKELEASRVASVKRLYEDIVLKSVQRFGSSETAKKMRVQIAQLNHFTLAEELYQLKSLISEEEIKELKCSDCKYSI